jgi:hypothetical protein
MDADGGALRAGGRILLFAGALAVPAPPALSGNMAGLDRTQLQRRDSATSGVHKEGTAECCGPEGRPQTSKCLGVHENTSVPIPDYDRLHSR